MWWYWVYDAETLSEIGKEWPLAWGPGEYFAREFIPTWKPDTVQVISWIVFFATLFTLLRSLLVTYILRPLGESRILANGFTPAAVVKYCESGTRLVFYTGSTIAIFIIALQQDYFYKPWQAWYVGIAPGEALTWLYYVEMGWYLHQSFAHVFLDKRKSDFLVMLSHHLITLLLLYFSWMHGYYRIGLLVLFSHDACDPFLEIGKISNYLHLTSLGIASFAGLIISWISLRLLFFPSLVYTAAFEGFWILGHDVSGYYFFNGLLWVLQALHFYWFILIVQVGLRVGRALANPDSTRGIDLDTREKKENKHKKLEKQT